MKMYMISTRGLCDLGTGFVVAKNEESAKLLFQKHFPVKDKGYENEIIKIEEIRTDSEKLVFYDDGDI